MAATIFQDIKGSLRQLYLEDERPWLVGFSGGKGLPLYVPLNVPVTYGQTKPFSHAVAAEMARRLPGRKPREASTSGRFPRPRVARCRSSPSLRST